MRGGFGRSSLGLRVAAGLVPAGTSLSAMESVPGVSSMWPGSVAPSPTLGGLH